MPNEFGGLPPSACRDHHGELYLWLDCLDMQHTTYLTQVAWWMVDVAIGKSSLWLTFTILRGKQRLGPQHKFKEVQSSRILAADLHQKRWLIGRNFNLFRRTDRYLPVLTYTASDAFD